MLRFTKIAVWFIGLRWLLSIVFMADETLSVGIEADFSDFEKQSAAALAKVAAAAEKAGGKAGDAIDEVESLGDEMAETGKKSKGFGDSAKKAGDAVDELGDDTSKTSGKVKQFVDVIDSAGKKVKAYRDENGRLRDETGKFVKASGGGTAGMLKMGAAFGVAAGAAGKLLDVVANIASSAIQMFKNLGSQAIQMAGDLEQVQLTFKNIFGSEDEATEFLAGLQIEANKLGVSFQDASQFAKSIFPDTKNVDEFNRVLKNAAIGAADAGLPLQELIFSFNEAVAGDFASIRDRLDIPKEVIERIKAAPDTVSALNEELEKLFSKRGVDNIEEANATLQGLQRQIKGFQEGLILLVGKEILPPLREGFQKIKDILDEYGPSLNHVATQLGEIVGSVVDFAQEEFFGAFDATVVFRMVEALQSAVEWLKNIVDGALDAIKIGKLFGAEYLKAFAPIAKFEFKAIQALVGWVWELFKRFTPLGKVVDAVGKKFEEAGGFFAGLQKALITGAQLFGLVGAAIKGLIALFSPLLTALSAGAQAIGAFLTLDFKGAMAAGKEGLAALKDGVVDTEGAYDAFKDSILASDEAIKKTTSSTKDLKDETKGAGEAAKKEEEVIEEGPTVDAAAQKKLEGFSDQLIDATENRNEQLEALEKSHAEKIKSITENAAKARLDIEENANQALIDNDKQSEKQRLKIIDDARNSLAKLAKDTDAQIEEKRDSFQKDELRDTEDHMRDMRKLTDKFLNDLEGAVRDRDAGAIVDLQRNFNAEKSERESDFDLTQNRNQEDQGQELDGLRKAESDKREEILAKQAEQLSDLSEAQEEKRTKILEDKDLALAALEEKLTEDLMKEQENYVARQQQLDEALKKKLESIAEAMAKEKDITEEGAQAILETLDETFGIGGDIDNMMEKFASRRSLKAEIDISFKKKSGVDTEEDEAVPLTPQQQTTQGLQSGGAAPGKQRLGGIKAFAKGGTLVANKPTLALFGDDGPEIAQFTPLSDISSGGSSGSDSKIGIEFSGSAPPGIGGADRDKIASVVVSALRETGVLS